MAKKRFTGLEIQEYAYEPLHERVLHEGRWGEDVAFVFEEYEDDWSKPTGRYYRATYFRGATENQDDMFDDQDCEEVFGSSEGSVISIQTGTRFTSEKDSTWKKSVQSLKALGADKEYGKVLDGISDDDLDAMERVSSSAVLDEIKVNGVKGQDLRIAVREYASILRLAKQELKGE